MERTSQDSDPMAGLLAADRGELKSLLDTYIGRALDTSKTPAFILISIEHFDVINTAFGFKAGDAILMEIQRLLQLTLRMEDTIVRFSGSKFAVILPDVTESKLMAACRRFRDNIRSRVFDTDAGPASVTVAISAVMMPGDANNAQEAIGNVLIALEDARTDRLRAISIYHVDNWRDRRRFDDARTAQNVICAIADNRLLLSYQPVVDSVSGRTAFHEALIRLVDTNGELRDAGSFVHAAERLGLVRMVDHRALDLALQQLNLFPAAILSVNIAADTVTDPAWLRKLQLAHDKNPDLAGRMIVEITESQAATDPEDTLTFVNAVRSLGCKVAIDDFGAGYTSFKTLREIPFDIIKIDGSFAKDLVSSPRNQVFIKALVEIARVSHARTVVEWVDTPECAEMLRDWGVDYLQGFGIAIPTSIAKYPEQPEAMSRKPAAARRRAAG